MNQLRTQIHEIKVCLPKGAKPALSPPNGTPQAYEMTPLQKMERLQSIFQHPIQSKDLNPETGKIEYQLDGKPMKIKIRMADAHFADETPQPLYFLEGHECAGIFKGMAVILQERGFGDMSKVWAECKDFKCAPGSTACCCHRILYNQPDFVAVESLLATCKSSGIKVMFLPKFHCELNFIEQCWRYAKRTYWLNPESSREDVLKQNALTALNSIPLESMWKFSNRSRRFICKLWMHMARD